MRALVEVAPVQCLLAPGEVLLPILVAKDAHIPLQAIQNLQHMGFRVVHQGLVHVATGRHLDLPFHDALHGPVLLHPVDAGIALDADDEMVADRLRFLQHQHVAGVEQIERAKGDAGFARRHIDSQLSPPRTLA